MALLLVALSGCVGSYPEPTCDECTTPLATDEKLAPWSANFTLPVEVLAAGPAGTPRIYVSECMGLSVHMPQAPDATTDSMRAGVRNESGLGGMYVELYAPDGRSVGRSTAFVDDSVKVLRPWGGTWRAIANATMGADMAGTLVLELEGHWVAPVGDDQLPARAECIPAD